jgi:hypothetical protein
MGKKNKDKEISKADFNRGLMSPFYGPGNEAQKMLKRYGVEGFRHGRTDRGSKYRGVDEVRDDLAKAMMNDYDTRRTMEAAAMAGNKDAKKFAKKGFKGGKVERGWEAYKGLKKEYVGGGGMDGPKNRAGLTYAAVKADRDAQTADYQSRFASIQDLNSLRDDLEAQEEAANYEPAPLEKSDALARAEDRLSEYEANPSGIYSNNNKPAATDNPPADASQHFLYDYKEKLKEKFAPLTNTEREVSNAAKRVQDAHGR